jgi:TetR/AcrR family transcriptional regulator, transcriptional repressor for nem operon
MARPRTFAEDEVVAAVREQFWARGYAGTSVEDLSAATGLGKGSLYGAFGDKHALFLRALDDYCAEALQMVRGQLRDPDRGAFDRLAHHIRAQAAGVGADTIRRGCLVARSAAELGGIDDEVTARIDTLMADWRGELADTIKAAQKDGDITAGRKPQTLATTVLAFLRGFEAMGKAGATPQQLKAAADEMVSLLRA